MNGDVACHEIISDFFEYTAFPLNSVLRFLCIQLLLHTLKSSVQLNIVKLISVLLAHSEHARNQCILFLTQCDSVLIQSVQENRFHQTNLCELELNTREVGIAFGLVIHPRLVQISYLVEETIAVDRKLVDHLLDDGLHLHESVYTSTDLLVQNFEYDSQEFEDRNLACVLIV